MSKRASWIDKYYSIISIEMEVVCRSNQLVGAAFQRLDLVGFFGVRSGGWHDGDSGGGYILMIVSGSAGAPC